ncbi:MAG: SDR family oxidoreductase [Proteobacteria bacterium]|nr:SDR family oxidoreductase [Pseudomonadota bacterium]
MDGGFDWLGLRGRVCVVTGAASGIGRATAGSLSQAGAPVALLDRDKAGIDAAAAELRAAGAKALAIACDTSDPANVAAAADAVRRELGACDVLVNNAGMLRAGPLDSVSLADWNAVLAVNLTGYLLCAQAFGRDMRQAGRGSIVHIASVAATHPQSNSGAYSASKAGVVILARQIAAEWGPSGVRSNAVSPGLIRTPLSEAFYQAPGIAEKRAAMTASRRVGGPQDIADVVVFLASDRAGYVNGAELLVDGGFDCMLLGLVPRPGFEAKAAR